MNNKSFWQIGQKNFKKVQEKGLNKVFEAMVSLRKLPSYSPPHLNTNHLEAAIDISQIDLFTSQQHDNMFCFHIYSPETIANMTNIPP
jgi:hypothetical protein